MSKQTTVIARLILKHIQGKITPRQKKQLDIWIAASDKHVSLIKNLTDPDYLTDAVSLYGRIEAGKKAAWAELVAKMDNFSEEFRNPKSFPWLAFPRIRWYEVVVFALLLAVAGYLWFQPGQTPGTDMSVSETAFVLSENEPYTAFIQRPGSSRILLKPDSAFAIKEVNGTEMLYKGDTIIYKPGSAAKEDYTHTIGTRKGAHLQIQLPDKSEVVLNDLSYLTTPLQFNGKQRRVALNGYAVFDVTANTANPFIVEIFPVGKESGKKAEIKAFGTHFSVDSRPGKESHILLASGEVDILYNDKTVSLQAGHMATITANGEIQTTSVKNADSVIAGQESLQFDGDDLKGVLEKVKAFYNLNYSLDKNSSIKLNASFTATTPFKSVLDVIEEHFEVKITVNGNHIMVTGKK